MTSEEVLALIPKARELGGKHLVSILNNLVLAEMPLPMTEERALKFRLVGKQSLRYLKLLRLVESTKDNDPYFGLSTRAKWRLISNGLETKDQILGAILSGLLNPSTLRGYGWKQHLEICRLVGIDPPLKPAIRRVHPNGNMNPERIRDASGNTYLMDAVFHDENGNVYLNGRKMSIEEAQKWSSDILEACRHAEARKKSK